VVTMDSLKVCSHCRSDVMYRLDEEVGLYVHWDGAFYFVDFVLVLPKRCLGLYRLVYRV
jgi:hypothetical protein